jgi:hypothetical protein
MMGPDHPKTVGVYDRPSPRASLYWIVAAIAALIGIGALYVWLV